MARKQAKRHKPAGSKIDGKTAASKKAMKPATGRTTRTAHAQVPAPASPRMPKYLESGSDLPTLKMAQWAVIDSRSMDEESIGRVHLPESQARIDQTISKLMDSKDERSQRAGATLFRLFQEGENQRHAAELKLRETSLEAFQAGRSAEIQAQLDKTETEGLGDDLLGQIEANMHEIARVAVEEAMAKK